MQQPLKSLRSSFLFIIYRMKAETTIIEIISTHMRLHPTEVTHETNLNWNLMSEINNDVCFALLTNINTMDALTCKNVGQYLLLVTNKLISK